MAPGMEYEVVMKFGETLDWKDEKNPNFHYKVSWAATWAHSMSFPCIGCPIVFNFEY